MSSTNEIRQKIGLEFGKEGCARFFSHHDLMRFFERALRRAELPVRLTEGFNPQPRLVFPAPLALGIASQSEYAEIEFTEKIPPQEVRRKLEGLMLSGMTIKSVQTLPPVRKGRKVAGSTLEFSGFPEDEKSLEALALAAEELGKTEVMEVDRLRKERVRRVDIAPSILSVKADGPTVLVELDNTCSVTARPDELAGFLCRNLCDLREVTVKRMGLRLI